MAKARIAYLKLSDYALYDRDTSGLTPKKVSLAGIVDREGRQRALRIVHGVAYDITRSACITICRDTGLVYVEFTLPNGKRALCWRKRVIKELWKLGINVNVFAQATPRLNQIQRELASATGDRVIPVPTFELHRRPSTASSQTSTPAQEPSS